LLGDCDKIEFVASEHLLLSISNSQQNTQAKTLNNQNLYALMRAQFPSDLRACALELVASSGNKNKSRPSYYTWGDLTRGSAKIANLFASLKIAAGERVAVQVEKSPEAVMLYLATLRAGLVFVPLNSAYQSSELDYFIGNSKPALVICSPQNSAWVTPIAKSHQVSKVYTLGEDRNGSLLKAAAPCSDKPICVSRSGSDLAAILYTSGTTGRSKGAMLSHDNMFSNANVLKTCWGWRKADVLLHALPIFHVHGLFVALHGALLSGSKMLWLNKFDAGVVIRSIERATVFMGVPTMYVRLLDQAQFNSRITRNMRLFVSGSAPLLTETFKQFEVTTGKRILERYGMSETIMLTSNPLDGERVAGTVGPALPGLQLRIMAGDTEAKVDEIGDIQVKGLSVFSGYWQMPEKTVEEFTSDGYFKTGDVGKVDSKGYVCIVGRSKDLIISGGFNVYPKEIESILDEMPGVAESAVIGVAHRDFGEAVTAVVVAKSGAKLNEASMIVTLKQSIANFKVPKRIYIVKELPRNTMGKVQKNVLRDQFSDLKS
jgi:malonyl-CoA/methylmalonyl-CoA synthetase